MGDVNVNVLTDIVLEDGVLVGEVIFVVLLVYGDVAGLVVGCEHHGFGQDGRGHVSEIDLRYSLIELDIWGVLDNRLPTVVDGEG